MNDCCALASAKSGEHSRQQFGGEAVELLGQVFGFGQRQQRLPDGQALESALPGGISGGRPGEEGTLAQVKLFCQPPERRLRPLKQGSGAGR